MKHGHTGIVFYFKERFLNTSAINLRILPAILALTAASWGMSAYAQAAATPAKPAASQPSAAESTKTAAKKAVKATKEAGSKAADAITKTSEKIDAKVPRTKAYKKMHPNEKKNPKPVTDAN
jgi:hypothetical protein